MLSVPKQGYYLIRGFPPDISVYKGAELFPDKGGEGHWNPALTREALRPGKQALMVPSEQYTIY